MFPKVPRKPLRRSSSRKRAATTAPASGVVERFAKGETSIRTEGSVNRADPDSRRYPHPATADSSANAMRTRFIYETTMLKSLPGT